MAPCPTILPPGPCPPKELQLSSRFWRLEGVFEGERLDGIRGESQSVRSSSCHVGFRNFISTTRVPHCWRPSWILRGSMLTYSRRPFTLPPVESLLCRANFDIWKKSSEISGVNSSESMSNYLLSGCPSSSTLLCLQIKTSWNIAALGWRLETRRDVLRRFSNLEYPESRLDISQCCIENKGCNGNMQAVYGINSKRTLSGTRNRTRFVTFPAPRRCTCSLSFSKLTRHLNQTY